MFFSSNWNLVLHKGFYLLHDCIGYLSARKDFLMANKKKYSSHLTLTDRTYIEQELVRGSSFTDIAKVLGKDPSTISKEVKLHYEVKEASALALNCHNCSHYLLCNRKHLCGRRTCGTLCKQCYRIHKYTECPDTDFITCNVPFKPPYVCNSCDRKNGCHNEKHYYHAKKAQAEYEATLVNSRTGINLTPEELSELDLIVSPLIKKGQPLSHIFAVHADDIPVCRRTLYNYLDQQVFEARNLDLHRRVRYKKRRVNKHTPNSKNLEQIYRNRRTYKDFEVYMEHHPDASVVELDTVKGTRDAGKCLMTLLFRSCNFMIIILLPRCTQEAVINAINGLYEAITPRLFKKYFEVILTDNGSEFKNPWDIEKDPSGRHRCYVFYCDPYASNQKGKLEKNHEYIRYVIPKGKSMQNYTQADINKLASHINSTARDGLNGATPFALANILIDKRIPILTGQFEVSPDDVVLKPELLKK